MNEIVIYIIKVIAIHGLMYLLYRLFLQKSARHSLNRGYLLFSFMMAFIIPFLEIPISENAPIITDENSLIVWISEPSVALQEFELVPVPKTSLSLWSFMPWLYGVVALIFLIKSILSVFALQRLKKYSVPITKRWFTLFKTTHNRPFSFFKNVFIPKAIFGSDSFEQILAHECVHVQQLHSIDRLLLDFVGSLFWFNPFIYLYRNALIEIHEYQADEAVVNRFKDPIGYQEILFSQLQSAQYSGLVSHFNFSMIKKRIVMMNKKSKMSGWVYALTAPIALMIVFAFSSKEVMRPIDEVGKEITSMIGPVSQIRNEAFELVEQDVQPSIAPVKDKDLTRLSSGFGMRMHPIKKTKQMHNGVDFSCKMGSDIMATADGTVIKLTNMPEGYGKMITLEHGDGFQSRYAQLSEFKVTKGDRVTKGQVIALSGSSGMSTAPHLHYEVIKDGKHVNPMDYITNYIAKPKKKNSDTDDLDRDESKKEKQEEPEELSLIQQEFVVVEQVRKLAKVEQKMAEYESELAQREMIIAEEERERAEMVRKIQEEKLKFDDSFRESISRADDQTKPLFVLDDEITSDVSDLDPSDIKEITVLKGKSATELYGHKAKDGVIIIKTKKKNKGKGKSKEKNKDRKSAFNKEDLISTQQDIISKSLIK